ncbi:hypothetical protein BH09PSE6_BH09PSE6_11880 [soil metagenome]
MDRRQKRLRSRAHALENLRVLFIAVASMAAFAAVFVVASQAWGRDIGGGAALATLVATPVVLRKLWRRPDPGRDCPGGKGLFPECLYVVTVRDGRLSVERPDGSIESVGIDTLGEVLVTTDDSGPFGSDLWWVLVASDNTRCTYPGGATGEKEAIHWMQQLPGFDNAALIGAMGSTANATFVCWRSTTGFSQAHG